MFQDLPLEDFGSGKFFVVVFFFSEIDWKNLRGRQQKDKHLSKRDYFVGLLLAYT